MNEENTGDVLVVDETEEVSETTQGPSEEELSRFFETMAGEKREEEKEID